MFLSATSKQTEGVFINVTNIAIGLKQSICSALEREPQLWGYQDKAGVMPKGLRVRWGVTLHGGWALAYPSLIQPVKSHWDPNHPSFTIPYGITERLMRAVPSDLTGSD